jgi:glycosyltransferase involved in cell wall biosynthesis
MNVLLACPGIFNQIGGGQRFYANLILNNPTIDFYCFGDAGASASLPQNAHFVQATDVHRRQSREFRLDEMLEGDPAEPLKRHPEELALLLDLAVAFDRVALSMHGALSMGIRDNWGEPGDLSSLIEHEELLYRYCDIRYGIGRQYIADWEEACGPPAQLLDISKIYDVVPAARQRAARAPMRDAAPDLCFIGRQEKWKGPDLFLELCSQLPRDAFAEVRLYGPTVQLHGADSMEELRRLARFRSLDITNEVVDTGRIIERMRDDRMVVVLPSRRDTFNLVAIEALLSGCPTVVSTRCGVCDFLDTVYPGIPYVKIRLSVAP